MQSDFLRGLRDVGVDRWEIYAGLYFVYQNKGDKDRAKEYFERATALNPEFSSESTRRDIPFSNLEKELS